MQSCGPTSTATSKNSATSRFSVDAALRYIQRSLDLEGKSKAAEYVWRAPDFVTTPLRAALQMAPWFAPSPNTSK
jgi:hypothetical protein